MRARSKALRRYLFCWESRTRWKLWQTIDCAPTKIKCPTGRSAQTLNASSFFCRETVMCRAIRGSAFLPPPWTAGAVALALEDQSPEDAKQVQSTEGVYFMTRQRSLLFVYSCFMYPGREVMPLRFFVHKRRGWSQSCIWWSLSSGRCTAPAWYNQCLCVVPDVNDFLICFSLSQRCSFSKVSRHPAGACVRGCSASLATSDNKWRPKFSTTTMPWSTTPM